MPTSRPTFKPPTQKTSYVDIPGANGSLDLSDSLTGYPVFNNREGSFEFLVLNGFHRWEELYSDISDYLHGKKMTAVLEDDSDYFYEGRFWIEDWQSTVPRSTVIIKYNVGPYKLNRLKSTDKWLWDPFNFETGVIRQRYCSDIAVNSGTFVKHTFPSAIFGNAPVCPAFTVRSTDGAGLDIKFTDENLGIMNVERHLTDGENIIPELVLYGRASYDLYFKGHGTVSVVFRNGRL